MEFRYAVVSVRLPNATTTTTSSPYQDRAGERRRRLSDTLGLRVSGWMVQAEYREEESHFDSDNDMLNKVWELSRCVRDERRVGVVVVAVVVVAQHTCPLL